MDDIPAKISIVGGSNVGGFVGQLSGGILSYSSVSGDVSIDASNNVGGLVGSLSGDEAEKTDGQIYTSYVSEKVSIIGDTHIGGLVGNIFNGKIENSYSQAAITGFSGVGGIVGHINQYGGISISSCYFAGTISPDEGKDCSNSGFGGIFGTSFDSAFAAADCVYLDTSLSAVENIGVTPTEDGGIPKSEGEMKTMSTYKDSPIVSSWSISDSLSGSIWYIIEDEIYPQLTPLRVDTIYISTPDELQKIGSNEYDAEKDKYYAPNANYILAKSIDMSGFDFERIGTIEPFTGTFDGQGYTISNLKIEAPISNNVGLFGCAFEATFSNVVLKNFKITGYDSVGGLVGLSIDNKMEIVSSPALR